MSIQLIGDRYEVGSLIGRGAMGEVYRGHDTQTGSDVAIKALKNERLVFNPDIASRFEREGELLRRLNHPNIVTTLGTYAEEEQHFIIMEYVSGGSLRDMIRNQSPLPIKRVLEIGLELSDALARVHRMNIVHRDIKPANVLVAEDGTPLLTDFGVAHVGDGTRITETGFVLGTYAYVSPEACYGHQLDARADIWSFGVMLYEMLVGRLPFDGDTPAAIITAILHDSIPDIQQSRSDVPYELAQLVTQMLEKNPEDRMESARQVGVVLEALLEGYKKRTTNQVVIEETIITTPSVSIKSARHNLPAQPTPFVGRAPEVQEISNTLNDPNCRLLTLLGPGGIGKTRLALEVAARNSESFKHGVFYVPLAPISTAEFVLPTIADALQFTFYDSNDDHRTQLLNYLHHKELLLVLDNFEHVLDAADLVAEIINQAHQVTAMVTSRETLNLQEEWVRRIAGMHFPDRDHTDRFEAYSATKLFIESARRVRADFDPDAERKNIVRILQLVQGMPLAIELATAWLRTLNCGQIADEIESSMDFLATRLRNVPERHRSLRAVFDYSWNLLTDDEKQVLARLSVFTGGFDREAAQDVADASFLMLSRLIDKSILQQVGQNRYDMHLLVRQYGDQKLSGYAELADQTRTAHSHHYLKRMQSYEAGLKADQQKEILGYIERDLDNIRAAWQWAAAAKDWSAIGWSMAAMYQFYMLRNWFTEGYELMGEALQALEITPTSSREHKIVFGQLLALVAIFAYGPNSPRREMLDRSRTILEELGVHAELKMTYHILGNLLLQDDRNAALELMEKSLAISEKQDDDYGIAIAMNSLGNIYWWMGDAERARQYYTDSLQISRRIGNQLEMAYSLNALGNVGWVTGESELSIDSYLQAIHIFEEFDSRFQLALSSFNLGDVYFEIDDFENATRFYKLSQKLLDDIGFAYLQMHCRAKLGDIARHSGRREDAMQHYRAGEAIGQRHSGIPTPIILNQGIGYVALDMENFEEARGRFVEALEQVVNFRNSPLILDCLYPFVPLAMAQRDDDMAATLIGTILSHESTRLYTAEQTRVYLAKLDADLQAAIEAGDYTHDPNELAQTLLE